MEIKEMNSLVLENMKLAYKAAHNFLKNHNIPDQEELISAAVYGLVKASREFDKNKGKFSSFAYKRIQWEILNNFKFQNSVTKIPYFKSKKGLRENFDYEVELFDKHRDPINYEEIIDTKIDIEKVYNTFDKLTKKQRIVMEHLYGHEFDGLEKARVANKLGVSKTSLYSMEARAIKTLRKELTGDN